MHSSPTNAVVADYLRRLEIALAQLPAARRDQLLAEISEHVTESLQHDLHPTDAAVRDVLARVGRPEDIAAEALRDVAAPPPLIRGRRAILGALAGVVVIAAVAVALVAARTPSAVQPAGTPVTVAAGVPPLGIAVDARSNTVYVGDYSNANVVMINAATCSGATSRGCAATPRALSPAGVGTMGVAVDQDTRTVYSVGSEGEGLLVAGNAATCNASASSGCSSYDRRAADVVIGGHPNLLAVNQRTNTVYVSDASTGTVAVIDGATCSARRRGGCARAPATVRLGFARLPLPLSAPFELGPRRNAPRTRSAAPAGGPSAPGSVRAQFGVVDERDGSGTFPIAADEANNTIYVGTPNSLEMIDGNHCDATDTSGCGKPPARVSLAGTPEGIAVDPTTRTVYVSLSSDVVQVINAASCNARDTRGCANSATTTIVGFGAAGLAVNPGTHTLYVALSAGHAVAIVNVASCDAATRAGCGATPKSFYIGNGPQLVAIDSATGGVFVTNPPANSVNVIDGSACNATTTAACPTAAPVTLSLRLTRRVSTLAAHFAVFRRPNAVPLPSGDQGGISGGPAVVRYLGKVDGTPVWVSVGPFTFCLTFVGSGICGSLGDAARDGLMFGGSGGYSHERPTLIGLVPDTNHSVTLIKASGAMSVVPVVNNFWTAPLAGVVAVQERNASGSLTRVHAP